jgi:hypothetical protein
MKSHKKHIKPRKTKSKLSRKIKLLRGGAEINLQIGSVIKTNAGPDIGQESKIKDIVIKLNMEQSAYSLNPSDFFITPDITPEQISIIRENGKVNSLQDFIDRLNNKKYILVNQNELKVGQMFQSQRTFKVYKISSFEKNREFGQAIALDNNFFYFDIFKNGKWEKDYRQHRYVTKFKNEIENEIFILLNDDLSNLDKLRVINNDIEYVYSIGQCYTSTNTNNEYKIKSFYINTDPSEGMINSEKIYISRSLLLKNNQWTPDPDHAMSVIDFDSNIQNKVYQLLDMCPN